MTLGLCLIALAAMARGGSEVGSPNFGQQPVSGQGSPKAQSSKAQKQKAQKEKPGAPKKVEYPPVKKPEPSAPVPPQRFRNLALPIGQRVDALFDALAPEERPLFLCLSQKAVEHLGIAAFDWTARGPDPRFPHPIGIAASFDVDLASRVAAVRAHQAKGQAMYAPIDVMQDPRWGLAGETFGEDPLLAGSLAATQVEEYRRAGAVAEIGELGRSGRLSEPPGPSEVLLSDRDLDAYLQPSKIAVAADSALGLWIDPSARASGSLLFGGKFLEDVFRKSWGLTGPILAPELVAPPTPALADGLPAPTAGVGSDMGGDAAVAQPAPAPLVAPQAEATQSGVGQPVAAKPAGVQHAGVQPAHGQAAGGQAAGQGVAGQGAPAKHPATDVKTGAAPPKAKETIGPVEALLSGCDLFTEEDCQALISAAKEKADVQKAIDLAVRRVLETEMRAGLFDPPPLTPPPARPANELTLVQERAAEESIVLLKNEGNLLPLKAGYSTVAVIGPNADNPAAVLGAEPGEKAKVITPLQAIKTALGEKTKVIYEKGTGLMGREDLQTIPADAFLDGLTGEYYDGPNFPGTPLTKKEDHLDLAWKDDPIDGIKAKGFSAIWTGTIVPKVPGKYGIGFTVDGAARLYVDDKLVVDDWHDGPTRTKTVGLELTTANVPFYVIRLEYERGAGSGSVRLVWSPPEEEPYRAAMEAAIKSDLVILVLGLDPSLEGAGHDRREIGLPDAQEGLLEQVAALHKPTVLVLLNGGPVSSPFAKQEVPAILEAWYPGEAGAAAIAGVLTGSVNPTGKLPLTIYRSADQLPGPLTPDAARGYRHSVFRPLYSFGFGLSYAHFAYSALNAPQVVDPVNPMTIGVTVKNVGRRAGEEVVQLYVSRDKPSRNAPRISLRGFRRVHLNVGESRRVVFRVTANDFSVLRADLSRALEAGAVRVSVGGNQPMDDLPPTVSATVRIR